MTDDQNGDQFDEIVWKFAVDQQIHWDHKWATLLRQVRDQVTAEKEAEIEKLNSEAFVAEAECERWKAIAEMREQNLRSIEQRVRRETLLKAAKAHCLECKRGFIPELNNPGKARPYRQWWHVRRVVNDEHGSTVYGNRACDSPEEWEELRRAVEEKEVSSC